MLRHYEYPTAIMKIRQIRNAGIHLDQRFSKHRSTQSPEDSEDQPRMGPLL